jgi:hypothetical protein
MRLGKSDWEGVEWNMDKARALIEQYRAQVPIIRAIETVTKHYVADVAEHGGAS